MELTHFSLFTGIGGIDLAAEWASFKTVGQCEWADYPTKVLEKHWPDVPRWRDIRSVTAENFYKRTGLRTVDLISGGFPCQPFSVAGKRKGKEDDRYLWPEMLRVISELKPTWVLGENVAGIVNMALDQVLSDLETQGYTTQAFIIPACAVNAPHRRDRAFIIAYAGGTRCNSKKSKTGTNENHKEQYSKKDKQKWLNKQYGISIHTILSNTTSSNGERNRPEQSGKQGGFANSGWWSVEPELGRVANGIPNRVDRLKCLGNAVVPQQVYPILQAIADIERSCHE